MRCLIITIFILILTAGISTAATKVDFRSDGICRVDGKPFFPIGMWVYAVDTAVIADLHEHQVNTVVGNGLKPGDIPMLEKHDLMCIPFGTDDFLKAAAQSPSLLAWYLIDEPEEHGATPADVKKMYDALKARDGGHPIGITHDMLIGPPKYKGSCDFTMTDNYPVTKDRDWPLKAVGDLVDAPRAVHGAGWPNFTFIQTFGGPDSDGGKWAVPLPHEVRFMAFDALIHRADGIFYFSYWPQAPITWASLAGLNADIERLVPWLIAEGEEVKSSADDVNVEIRTKRIGQSWMILAANTSPRRIETTLRAPGVESATLRSAFENETIAAAKGQWPARLGAYETKAWLIGDVPGEGRRATAAPGPR